jgi:hypothetical protein
MSLHRPPSTMVKHGSSLLSTVLDDLRADVDNAGSPVFRSVKDYGALGDDSHNDRDAIQAAIDAATTAGGGVVFLPAGDYRIGAALNITGNRVTLMGEGSATTLKMTSSGANMVQIGDGVANPNDVVVERLRFTATTTMAAGTYAIVVKNGHNITLRDFRMDGYGTLYNAIQLLGGSAQYVYAVQNFEINQMQNNSIVIDSLSGSRPQNIFISNGEISAGNLGILLRDVTGVYISMIECLGQAQDGISVYPPSGATVRYVMVDQSLVDSCTRTGFFLSTGNGGTVYDVQITDSWAASNGYHGMELSGDTILVSGCKITNNNQNGIITTSASKNLVINTNHVVANNMGNYGNCHGIYIAPGVENFVVNGNQSGIGTHYGFNYQRYGVYVDTGASDHYIVRGNLVRGNVSGGVNDGGSGGNKSVGDNVS